MTTLPIDPELFWGAVILGGLLLSSLVVMAMISPAKASETAPLEKLKIRLGLRELNSGLLIIAVLLWVTIFLALVAGLLAMIWDVIWTARPTGADEVWDWRFTLTKLTALTAVLGAVVALPFTVIRMGQTDEQNRHNELVLLNDRIQSALALLSARATETRIARTVEYTLNEVEYSEIDWQEDPLQLPEGANVTRFQDWQVYELDAPDIQTRLSGIGQLEAILQEEEDKGNARLRRRINEYLANFIRANPRAPEAPPDLIAPNFATAPRQEIIEWRQAVQSWARNIALRADIQAAITLIGSATGPRDTEGLDLRGVNLQGADLPGAFLEGVRFQGARLQGANLFRAELQGADLQGAELQGADLGFAQLHKADLVRARLQGANVYGARWQGAHLGEAQLQGANLHRAQLQEADLSVARLQGADLSGAQLQGADLALVRMQRANLNGAHFDASTNLDAVENANLRGAAVRAVDFTSVPKIADHLYEIYGDSSTKLPKGVARPKHWPKEKLNLSDFYEKWRAWQDSLGPDPEADAGDDSA